MLQHVSVLAVEGMLASSITIPMEMLEAVRARSRVQQRRDPGFCMEVVAQNPEPLKALGGLTISPDATLEGVGRTCLIVVPALWRNPEPQVQRSEAVVRWIAEQYRRGATIMSVGTGVCLVAESGILNGKPATTHWHYLDQFARSYPKVNLQRRYLLTQSRGVYCAASVNSGADMVIHFISQLYGRDLALQIEQQFSPEVRNPFNKHIYSHDESSAGTPHADEDIAMAQSVIRQKLTEPLVLPELASTAGLSVRQFHRRFRQVTGQTPIGYQHTQRCSAARELLQDSNLSVAEVGASVGFVDAAYFIRVFKRLAGQTPGEYRRKVRGKLFTIP